MTLDDLKTVAQIGRALWANPSRAEPITVETLSAVSLLQLTGERATERAARALLDRAGKEGMAGNVLGNLSAGSAFFKLYPEERFLLVALHLARWSYERVARVLGDSPEGVQARAWRARVNLAADKSGAGKSVAYPAGSAARGANCPEYDAKLPWTQRFLDEELSSGRERLFLQNHLMACDSCRGALSRCRDVYYAVDARIPRLDVLSGNGSGFIKDLERIQRESDSLSSPGTRSFLESLGIFLGRSDVRWTLLAALGAFVLLKIITP